MRAMQYRRYGEPPTLVDLPVPTPGKGEVLVRVSCASVNPVDWKKASGTIRFIMPVKLPCTPGFDLAGVVEAVGPGAPEFSVGMRVHTRLSGQNGGASAEYAVCGIDVLAPMPAAMDFASAAGLPLAGMTALQGLRDEAGMPMTGASERVLVVGASGGVGHLAVQIARAAGATVIGVCSGKNAGLVRDLGAHEVIDYRAADPFAALAPVDIVLDCVGGPPAPWLPLLKEKGRFASTTAGVAVVLRTGLNILTSKRVRPVLLKSNSADLRVLNALFEAGKLRVVVDARYPLADLNAAWDQSKAGRTAGKIVVDVA